MPPDPKQRRLLGVEAHPELFDENSKKFESIIRSRQIISKFDISLKDRVLELFYTQDEFASFLLIAVFFLSFNVFYTMLAVFLH
jgi:hypothetical protein